ncbi:hypothetical protein KQ874_00320 [Mycoplasma sp. ES3157-GEN-MYC]|uniref:Lipoprotein n=1 Tax=Mycoplasma miroungigenitalium TaxID=754515 RepID=A0A6M4JB12_9MOLU|nr:hypothetical protein [Mycoplasma miroungigenitalium]MBU4690151.1 hypothetical protein [Mycoplasma miroungigenitalium]QJR43259.1 hypothetical protein HLA87_00330 [Mycoplasma miroungigenitalium]
MKKKRLILELTTGAVATVAIVVLAGMSAQSCTQTKNEKTKNEDLTKELASIKNLNTNLTKTVDDLKLENAKLKTNNTSTQNDNLQVKEVVKASLPKLSITIPSISEKYANEVTENDLQTTIDDGFNIKVRQFKIDTNDDTKLTLIFDIVHGDTMIENINLNFQGFKHFNTFDSKESKMVQLKAVLFPEIQKEPAKTYLLAFQNDKTFKQMNLDKFKQSVEKLKTNADYSSIPNIETLELVDIIMHTYKSKADFDAQKELELKDKTSHSRPKRAQNNPDDQGKDLPAPPVDNEEDEVNVILAARPYRVIELIYTIKNGIYVDKISIKRSLEEILALSNKTSEYDKIMNETNSLDNWTNDDFNKLKSSHTFDDTITETRLSSLIKLLTTSKSN